MNSISLPRLTEFSAKTYMQDILHTCHENRVNVYLYLLNFGVLILFGLITFFSLYYCYNRKLSPHDSHQKQLKEQEYILSKIRYYKEHQRHIQNSAGITSLPVLDNRPI